MTSNANRHKIDIDNTEVVELDDEKIENTLDKAIKPTAEAIGAFQQSEIGKKIQNYWNRKSPAEREKILLNDATAIGRTVKFLTPLLNYYFVAKEGTAAMFRTLIYYGILDYDEEKTQQMADKEKNLEVIGVAAIKIIKMLPLPAELTALIATIDKCVPAGIGILELNRSFSKSVREELSRVGETRKITHKKAIEATE